MTRGLGTRIKAGNEDALELRSGWCWLLYNPP